MEALRKVTLWILMLVMLLCECVVMGIFAVDAGSGQKSVAKALAKSDIISDIVEESLKKNSVNGEAFYGETIEKLAKSDAMTEFFATYISNGIRESVYGYEVEEIAYDKLLQAVDEGIAQVNRESDVNITSDQKQIFMGAVSRTAPDLTKGLNTVISGYEATATGEYGETAAAMENKSAINTVMKLTTRIILIAVIAFTIMLIAMLSRSDRRGILRVAGTTLVATLLYGYAAFRGTGAVSESSDIFLNELVKSGAGAVAIGGLVTTAIMVVIGIVVRRGGDRRKQGEFSH